MALKTLKLSSTKDITSKQDPEAGTPEATVFTIRALDSRIMGQINDAATAFASADATRIDTRGATILNIHEANFKIAQFGLVGWRNLRDDANNDVKFVTVERIVAGGKYEVVDPELLKTVPPAVIDELGVAIKNFNIVTEAEVKN
jgi:hypothetical protein